MARRIPQKPFAPTAWQRGHSFRLGDGPELTLVDKAGLPGSWWAVDDEGNHFRVHPKQRGVLDTLPAGDTGVAGIEAARKLAGAGGLWVADQFLHRTGCGSLERTPRVFGVRVGTPVPSRPATDDDVCAAGGAWLREKWQAERNVGRRVEVRACQCVVSLFDPSDTPKSTRLRPEVSGV